MVIVPVPFWKEQLAKIGGRDTGRLMEDKFLTPFIMPTLQWASKGTFLPCTSAFTFL
jgi:hypothetical protein